MMWALNTSATPFAENVLGYLLTQILKGGHSFNVPRLLRQQLTGIFFVWRDDICLVSRDLHSKIFAQDLRILLNLSSSSVNLPRIIISSVKNTMLTMLILLFYSLGVIGFIMSCTLLSDFLEHQCRTVGHIIFLVSGYKFCLAKSSYHVIQFLCFCHNPSFLNEMGV